MKNPVDKNILNKALKDFLNRLERTEKFVLEQAPEVCKQMIKEQNFSTIVNLAAATFWFLVSTIALFIAAIQMYGHPENADGYFWTPRAVIFGISVIVGTCSLDGILIQIKSLYFIKNCPKLFLLREFKELNK